MELQENLDTAETLHGGDCLLSATGEKQLRFVLKTKVADLQNLIPKFVYCSPLQRALRTALVAYPFHNIIVDPRLREIGTYVGMERQGICAFIDETAPQRTAKVDTTRVPEAAWWGDENEKMAHTRVQRVLREIYKKTSKGKVCAIVAHGGVFKTMIGKPKPFPKLWGNPRGFPKNFRPYYGTIDGATPGYLKLVPATVDAASVVLLRHAHSRAQTANSLLQKIDKFRSSSVQSAEAAAALDTQIKKFKASAPRG